MRYMIDIRSNTSEKLELMARKGCNTCHGTGWHFVIAGGRKGRAICDCIYKRGNKIMAAVRAGRLKEMQEKYPGVVVPAPASEQGVSAKPARPSKPRGKSCRRIIKKLFGRRQE